MKKTITESDFIDDFMRAYPNAFSHEGLGSLFDYFEENDPDMELDIHAVYLGYTESTVKEILGDFSIDPERDLGLEKDEYGSFDDDELFDAVKAYLEKNTTVAGNGSGSIVYQTWIRA